MFAYARLTPGPGFELDRALLYYAQRLVTWPVARRTISSMIATHLRQRHGMAQAVPERAARAVSDLRRNGIAMLDPLLPGAAIDAMTEYFLQQEVIGPDGVSTALDALPDGAAAAAYPLKTVLDCPGLLGALNSPEVLQIASRYLGCKPTLSSVGVRWSFPAADRRSRTQDYHRDLDDWRFLKLFIYLTDVDEGCGPHSYVKSSHATGFGLTAKAYDLGSIERRYGAATPVLGSRGTTFMADTLGIHCGLPPTEGPRLILQIQYSLLPVYAFHYAPERRAEPGLDPYCNRLLFSQQANA